MFQIAVAAGSLSLTLGRSANSEPKGWVFLIVGAVLLFLGLVMERIRWGITNNNNVLRQAAAAVGDEGIPLPTTSKSSFSAWTAYAVIIFGLASIIFGILKLAPITICADSKKSNQYKSTRNADQYPTPARIKCHDR